MPLTPPIMSNWGAGEFPGAAKMNAQLRDNMGFLIARPVLRAWDGLGTQVVANTTNTIMVLNTLVEDTFSGWTAGAGNKYTAQVDGLYLVIVTYTSSGGSGNMHYAAINYNAGSQIIAGQNQEISTTVPNGCQI